MVIKMNVPKLRFKGFTEEWQNYKIKDLGKIITGTTPPTSDKENYGESYLWASPIDMGINKYINNTKNKLSEKGFQKIRKIPANSVLITCIGSTIGKTAISKYEMSTNQQINSLICNKQFNYEYCYYCINFNFPKFLSKISFQAVPIISKSEFEKLTLAVTKNMYEQEKIGNMLSLLDKKIELQSKKIEALKLYKLCISNIYFKEQDEKNYKISDFCYIITSSSKNNYIEFGGKKFIMDMGTVDSDGNIIYSKPTNYDKDIISKGDLIMPKDDIGGGLIIGKTAYIDAENKYILGDHVFCLKCKNINSLYLHYLINSIYVNKLLRKKVTGSAQLGINSKNVLNQEIFVHEKVEQNKIADTLLLIDNNILLNKKNLEKLIFFKKGLMQKMFV